MNNRIDMEAFLHFGGVFTNEQPSTRLTVSTEVKENLLWWQKRNLMFTRTGYGKRIPTTYMVKHEGRWKRVYCSIFSNGGVCYIETKRKPIATVDIYI